jgi:hypothetical protein
MGLAKLLSLDLCPRLADLGDRKLFVPRGIEVPEVLLPVTERLTEAQRRNRSNEFRPVSNTVSYFFDKSSAVRFRSSL